MSTADGWTPLLLSTVAGMSTCLGAAIVFFQPKTRASDGSTTRRVGPNLQAFSLALAGSVMLTVSVISIGPECLLDPTYETRLDIARENALAKAKPRQRRRRGVRRKLAPATIPTARRPRHRKSTLTCPTSTSDRSG